MSRYPYTALGDPAPDEGPARADGGPVIRDRAAGVDGLLLPASLERVGDDLRVTGHRVSLFHVLDALLDGASIDRLGEMFPTVPSGKLQEVVAFCRRHADLMREYHAGRRAAFSAGAGARVSAGPTRAELRRRKAEQRGPDERNGE